MLADANKRFLNSMGYQNGPMIIQICVAFGHMAIVWLLTFQMEFGVYGPPVAISISNFLFCASITIYTSKIKDWKVESAWKLPNRQVMEGQGLKEFLKIGVPSILMACIELWSFELMALLAALMSVEAIAT
jgi:Na+-driven multidrug efflux pump